VGVGRAVEGAGLRTGLGYRGGEAGAGLGLRQEGCRQSSWVLLFWPLHHHLPAFSGVLVGYAEGSSDLAWPPPTRSRAARGLGQLTVTLLPSCNAAHASSPDNEPLLSAGSSEGGSGLEMQLLASRCPMVSSLPVPSRRAWCWELGLPQSSPVHSSVCRGLLLVQSLRHCLGLQGEQE
jgi:hypothetical protein